MSQKLPLMPKATAVWLVDNTALTFDQIARFTGLHVLEVHAIADGEAAQNIKGLDPINAGQLDRDEIKKGEADQAYQLKLLEPKFKAPESKRKGPRYTPLARRQDRPNAILWIVRNYPGMKDAQITRLLGTTKHTISQIRERSHWNYANLTPQDPVILGLCTQIELDKAISKLAEQKAANAPVVEETLQDQQDVSYGANASDDQPPHYSTSQDIDVSKVFAKLKDLDL